MFFKLIDTHCHLDFPDYVNDREEVIKRALEEGVGMIIVGTNEKSSKKAVEIAEKHDGLPAGKAGIFAAIGLHPHDAREGFDTAYYRELAKHPKVVGIGECGLDYSKIQNATLSVGKQDLSADRQDSKFKTIEERQKEIFIKQIELALEVKKPLMIHCRGAHKEVIAILERKGVHSGIRGNIHFFSGTFKEAQEYIKLGFTLSFTGVITFTHDYDEVIKKIPLDKIMVETDAPFVAPQPWRSQRCEPLYVKEVAKQIAEIKGLSFNEVAEKTTKNAVKLFHLS